MLASLQAGARGTQACINAHSAVQAIIGDLDTTIMFATAGTLNSENEKETFADYRFVDVFSSQSPEKPDIYPMAIRGYQGLRKMEKFNFIFQKGISWIGYTYSYHARQQHYRFIVNEVALV